MIQAILQNDEIQPKKQRHTARRIYIRLREEYGFQGSEASVRRCVAELRRKTPEVFLPLEYEPGAEAQVDFGGGNHGDVAETVRGRREQPQSGAV